MELQRIVMLLCVFTSAVSEQLLKVVVATLAEAYVITVPEITFGQGHFFSMYFDKRCQNILVNYWLLLYNTYVVQLDKNT